MEKRKVFISENVEGIGEVKFYGTPRVEKHELQDDDETEEEDNSSLSCEYYGINYQDSNYSDSEIMEIENHLGQNWERMEAEIIRKFIETGRRF